MNVTRKALCWVYGAIGLLALLGTWGNNVPYLALGLLDGNLRFWMDTLANPASRSITVDIFFLSLAVFVWMLLEARRLGMRHVWLYVVFSILIAVSLMVPIFLIHRERVLLRTETGSPRDVAGQLRPLDVAGLIAMAVLCLAYVAKTFFF